MRKEQSVLRKIMKVFASKEILIKQYVLEYGIVLYFYKHKLATEIDAKGHKNRNKYKEIERQKAIEKDLDIKLFRINPVEKYFDEYAEIEKLYNHINKSSENLIDNISKRLLKLEFKSNHLIKLKTLKYVVKKYCHYYKTMKTFCLSCKKYADNIDSKKVIMTNKVIKQASKCARCVAEKSRFLKQKSNKKTGWDKINPKLFIY